MTYVADLHTHSPFARATSKELSFENLAQWAELKGIDLMASTDFTHPAWFQETAQTLRESGDGLYEYGHKKFILGTEINCTGYQDGRHRRIHMLVFAPSLDTVERINAALAPRSNDLGSDGRPTLQLLPKDLVETLLEIDSRCMVIPAHIWTPWFGIYGSKSGFDSLEECFGGTLRHIYAVETGLSSDPAMCWRVPELDNLSIVSFSDAHSLPNLGRELTVIQGDLSYDGLAESLRTQGIEYTVEFFPEEGKYHYSGHRRCGVSYSPEDVAEHGPRCPACGRRITLGVMQRVDELAARDSLSTWTDEDGLTRGTDNRPPFRSLIALRQIIAEAVGVGVNTKRVQAAYFKMVGRLDNELSVLTQASFSDIVGVSDERIAEGVARVRRGDIVIQPGYDGQYGTVKVWPDGSDPTQSQLRVDV